MAFSTKKEVLTPAWREIGVSGTTNVAIQLKGGKSAMIYIGEEAPEDPDEGFTLSTAGQGSFAAGDLTNEKIFARSVSSTATIVVIKN